MELGILGYEVDVADFADRIMSSMRFAFGGHQENTGGA
jgi:6-phosphogluconate dehydrogenase (decarboxylating)